LLGWDAAVALPAWRGLRLKVDVSHYNGSNLGAPQHPLYIQAGPQYERTWRKERFFAQSLFGDCLLNRNWGAQETPGGTASFAILMGGGVDTPLSRHFALRVEGDMQHTTFALIKSTADQVPYRIPGLPSYFGRISAGLVWTPWLQAANAVSPDDRATHVPPEWEIAYEDMNSFGHFHVFAFTWWSSLHLAGVEYDRHSWGKFMGARTDYVAEFLPVALLIQPSKTDVFGDELTLSRKTNAGAGISPIGLRMLWRDGKRWKPYLMVKMGVIGFSQKALSYQNFSMEQDVGIQFRLNANWDLRTGFDDFHFSNAFMVPNNPGIDEMMWHVALSHRFKPRIASH
jgi:hypothetical protein